MNFDFGEILAKFPKKCGAFVPKIRQNRNSKIKADSLLPGQFIKLTVQSLTLEIFQTSGSCAICVTKVIFSGYEKLQVDTYLIPPGKTKLNEGTGKWIYCFFKGSTFVDISISG